MAKPETIQVAIVEDDPGTRERLVSAVNRAPDLFLAACFETGRAALTWLEEHSVDVLLADLGLPDLPGLAVISYCAQRHPATEIMVITMYEDESHVMRSLEAGASGYLLKDSLHDEVAERIRELAAGGSPMTPVIARQVLRRFQPARRTTPSLAERVSLSDRELLVLTRIAQGFSYAEIASLESISRHTVHTHIKNIYSKLAVHSKNEAVFEAGRMGLIDTQF